MTPEGVSGTTTTRTRADPAMVKALARAFRWKRLLEAGRYSSISEIAAAETIDRGYVGSILRLTLLAPNIVEAIMDGRQPTDLGLSTLLEPFPLNWVDQQAVLLTQVSQESDLQPRLVARQVDENRNGAGILECNA